MKREVSILKHRQGHFAPAATHDNVTFILVNGSIIGRQVSFMNILYMLPTRMSQALF